MNADLINGLFELGGAGFNLMNIRRLNRDKKVMGVCWEPTVFWAAWGLWNLYFYPYVGATLSFIGAFGVVATNVVWLSMLYRYRSKTNG